jgi:hypothetical protein
VPSLRSSARCSSGSPARGSSPGRAGTSARSPGPRRSTAGGLGNLLWFTLIDRVGPGRAGIYLHLQPFLGALFAVLVISETLKPVQVAGGAVVGAGIVLARVRQRAAPAAE